MKEHVMKTHVMIGHVMKTHVMIGHVMKTHAIMEHVIMGFFIMAYVMTTHIMMEHVIMTHVIMEHSMDIFPHIVHLYIIDNKSMPNVHRLICVIMSFKSGIFVTSRRKK